MHDARVQVDLSPLDEARFGVRSARAYVANEDDLTSVNRFCFENNVTFLIVRCPASALQTIQAMESDGFQLMDTLIYYRRDLQKTPIPADEGSVPVRPIRPGDEAAVVAIAVEAFQGYFGHYHADPRLDRAQCDAVYTSWAKRSATSREVADEVLVAEMDGRIAGFATLRFNSADEGEGVLFGVAPFAQGRGIYRSFMVRSMQWCAEHGRRYMIVSTQITNLAVQKVWVRLGFEPSHAYYTFHKWYDT